MGEALGRRRKATLRLAKRQVWFVLADHPLRSRQDVARKDAGNSKKVWEAVLHMDKLDIKGLKQAYHEG